MSKLAAVILIALLSSATVLRAQETPKTKIQTKLDRDHTEWIDHVMHSIASIQPGMTRKELSDVFTTEGGISNRKQRKYVYKDCPHMKVDVEFSYVDGKDRDRNLIESPDDKIVKMSRPYLEYTVSD